MEDGNVFGEMALTGQSLKGLYVRVLTPTIVVSLRREELERLIMIIWLVLSPSRGRPNVLCSHLFGDRLDIALYALTIPIVSEPPRTLSRVSSPCPIAPAETT